MDCSQSGTTSPSEKLHVLFMINVRGLKKPNQDNARKLDLIVLRELDGSN